MTSEPAHLNPNDLAGYLERQLDSAQQQRIVAHLEGCAVCREELAQVARLVDAIGSAGPAPVTPRVPASRPLWMQLALGGAIAAGLAFVVFRAPGPVESVPGPAPVRAPATGEGLGRIEVLSPSDSPGTSSDSLVFRWRSAGADVYRFALLSESGEELWTGETQDTSLSLPPTVVLAPGTAYWWRIDAIADGITASTGARPFRLSP
jgi:hypothetical protein